MKTCFDCKNALVCHDQGECLRPTPETDAANWKQLYAEAVERGNLFQSQRDEARAEAARLQMELDASCNAEELRQVREENARLLALLREVRFVAYQPPLVREMISTITP